MNHYLLLVFEGKSEVTREYMALLTENESKEDAIERWIENHPRMKNRQRNVEKTREALRQSISWTYICHPSSWIRAQKAGVTSVPSKPKRRKT